MLFYHGLKGEKRYWVEVGKDIEYRPIADEQECENATSISLKEANATFEAELMPRAAETTKNEHGN